MTVKKTGRRAWRNGERMQRNNVSERDGKTNSWMTVDGICSGRRHFQIIYYLVS